MGVPVTRSPMGKKHPSGEDQGVYFCTVYVCDSNTSDLIVYSCTTEVNIQTYEKKMFFCTANRYSRSSSSS